MHSQEESTESLKSQISTLKSDKIKLQSDFDTIKLEWSRERQSYKNTIAELEEHSRKLKEDLKKSQEQYSNSEETIITFQKITETQTTLSKDLSNKLQVIYDKYVLKKGLIRLNLERFIENLDEIKLKLKGIADEFLEFKQFFQKNSQHLTENLFKTQQENHEKNEKFLILQEKVESLQKEKEELELFVSKDLEAQKKKNFDLINSLEEADKREKFQINQINNLKVQMKKAEERLLEVEGELNTSKLQIKRLEERLFEAAEREKAQLLTNEEQKSCIKDQETRIKALSDLIKAMESDKEQQNSLYERKTQTLEKEKQVLITEMKKLEIELVDLKEIFFNLQENQQQGLINYISSSAEKLLRYSAIKEQEKIEDLKQLKAIEQDLKAQNISEQRIRSPKLDLILQQQKSLIQQIKEKTQHEREAIKEFEMSCLDSLREDFERKLQENREKRKESDSFLFERRYIQLLENKRKEIQGFLQTIEEMEEDKIYLKEIIKTKDFEVFFLRSELFNQRAGFKYNVKKVQQEIVTLKNFITNIKLLTTKEREQFFIDFKEVSKAILKEVYAKNVKKANEDKQLVQILIDHQNLFEKKFADIHNKISIYLKKTNDFLNKLKRIGEFLAYKKGDLIKKLLKIYEICLKNNEYHEILSQISPIEINKLFDSQELSLQIVLPNEKNALKTQDLQNFTQIILLSLARIGEISKTIAQILKSFMLMEYKYPVKFNRNKDRYLNFIKLIEENHKKISFFYEKTQENVESQHVLETFLDGFDLLSQIIKEIFDYKSASSIKTLKF